MGSLVSNQPSPSHQCQCQEMPLFCEFWEASSRGRGSLVSAHQLSEHDVLAAHQQSALWQRLSLAFPITSLPLGRPGVSAYHRDVWLPFFWRQRRGQRNDGEIVEQRSVRFCATGHAVACLASLLLFPSFSTACCLGRGVVFTCLCEPG